MQHDENSSIWAPVRSLISTLCIRVQKRDTDDGEVINVQERKCISGRKLAGLVLFIE